MHRGAAGQETIPPIAKYPSRPSPQLKVNPMPHTWDLTTARGRRAMMIDMCRRRQRPGTGSDLDALMKGGPWMQWPDLSDVLGPIPWAVIGAVATRRYMPERVTRDLDVMISADDRHNAAARLRQAGWEETGRLTIGGTAWLSPEGVGLDLVESAEPWCREAIAEAQTTRDKQGLPVLPLPYLVLTKLSSGRVQDTADLSRMLGMADEAERDRVRETVARHVPQDSEDVDALIELGKLETGR